MHYHMMTLRKLSLTILPSCEESHPPHLMQTDGNRGRQLQLIYRIDALWEAAQAFLCLSDRNILGLSEAVVIHGLINSPSQENPDL